MYRIPPPPPWPKPCALRSVNPQTFDYSGQWAAFYRTKNPFPGQNTVWITPESKILLDSPGIQTTFGSLQNPNYFWIPPESKLCIPPESKLLFDPLGLQNTFWMPPDRKMCLDANNDPRIGPTEMFSFRMSTKCSINFPQECNGSQSVFNKLKTLFFCKTGNQTIENESTISTDRI